MGPSGTYPVTCAKSLKCCRQWSFSFEKCALARHANTNIGVPRVGVANTCTVVNGACVPRPAMPQGRTLSLSSHTKLCLVPSIQGTTQLGRNTAGIARAPDAPPLWAWDARDTLLSDGAYFLTLASSSRVGSTKPSCVPNNTRGKVYKVRHGDTGQETLGQIAVFETCISAAPSASASKILEPLFVLGGFLFFFRRQPELRWVIVFTSVLARACCTGMLNSVTAKWGASVPGA